MKTHPSLLLLALLLPLAVSAQVNSGSNGSDGALNPTSNLVIDMARPPLGSHPPAATYYTQSLSLTASEFSLSNPGNIALGTQFVAYPSLAAFNGLSFIGNLVLSPFRILTGLRPGVGALAPDASAFMDPIEYLGTIGTITVEVTETVAAPAGAAGYFRAEGGIPTFYQPTPRVARPLRPTGTWKSLCRQAKPPEGRWGNRTQGVTGRPRTSFTQSFPSRSRPTP